MASARPGGGPTEPVRAAPPGESGHSVQSQRVPVRVATVAHELVHLLHADHGRQFWRTLGRVMPDYAQRKERLGALGLRLEW